MTISTSDYHEIVTSEHLNYLDTLRKSGVTNMFGAGNYLASEFGLGREDCSTILKYWMATFSERRNESEA